MAALEGVAGEPDAGVLCVHGDVLEELCGEEIEKGATVIFDRKGLAPVAVLPPRLERPYRQSRHGLSWSASQASVERPYRQSRHGLSWSASQASV